ncbi:membrane protein insertase YidC [Gracilinema caldarium]|uniref:Membrane protein insertase YidC n=1 Tax=Gracilinema caldarium (strain ATCC 51460 / DSM 7334 / H1) TaxID=744872 RepID=F8EWL6_GRAC1|nr:membrane protein insertase YidC [Gracilinema caldarium]AEJ18179.1 Membrane protein oxaA [Gracilinema caldarium DSM 7334]
MDEEKRILLAVVLSVVVISGSFMLQSYFAPPPKPQNITTEQAVPVDVQQQIKTSEQTSTVQGSEISSDTLVIAPEESALPVAEEKITIETNVVRAVLSNKGGDIVSYKLKEHKDKDDYVEMVLPASEESHAFTLAFGGIDAKPRTELFAVNRVSDTVVEFYRDYILPKNGTEASSGETAVFRLVKRYDFKQNDYMFELSITLDGGYSVPSLNFNGVAYTLEFGPQIGPKFEKLDQRYEYRHYYTYTNGKQKTEKVDKKAPTLINSRLSWAAIAGKYFTFIAVPDATNYTYAFSSVPVPGLQDTSRFYIIRPSLNGSRTTDVLRFYLGPKTQKALSAYDVSDKNAFKLSNMNMTAVANTSGILGPVETVLKWFMIIFYKIIPNYGIAIILLTILVKLAMFPLTKKGSESTIRMQELAPKIKEIQDKYKDNPTKMNTEMAELYKKEGYNPMAGCLPMLLQIPIFFAMYNLFNNHFDLRGAMFIPGWIPDLSLPESVFSFAPYKIPLLNWSDIRLLPFIYLVSQLLYGKVTQTPDQQNNSQMKMMLYVMPIMFFFILYDVPSGLLVYWIMSNMLTLVQQMIINRYLAKHKATRAVSEPVIAPKRKKNK